MSSFKTATGGRSMTIPDASAVEGVVLHWLRQTFDTSPAGSPDSISMAAGDAIYKDVMHAEIDSEWSMAFSVGAEFGARVAMAVLASPLGGAQEHIEDAHTEALSKLADFWKSAKADRELTAVIAAEQS